PARPGHGAAGRTARGRAWPGLPRQREGGHLLHGFWGRRRTGAVRGHGAGARPPLLPRRAARPGRAARRRGGACRRRCHHHPELSRSVPVTGPGAAAPVPRRARRPQRPARRRRRGAALSLPQPRAPYLRTADTVPGGPVAGRRGGIPGGVTMSDTRKVHGVQLGDGVTLRDFVNLYGCTIGDNSKIGTFVELQAGRVIG